MPMLWAIARNILYPLRRGHESLDMTFSTVSAQTRYAQHTVFRIALKLPYSTSQEVQV